MKKFIGFILLSILMLGIMSGFNQNDNQPASLLVQSKIKDNNVFVECILSGISFRESEQKNQKVGKLVIWLDGKKTREVNTAAFIIKGLSPGNHQVKLEVVDLKNVPYGLTKEFLVNIPK
ncbi:hypothetical protein V7111_25605 [Neobacillus niacini]|uniref:hypothetical protein n=1 Tax=Neobacillus niacini TaxID=86668 RepID=UPI0030020857